MTTAPARPRMTAADLAAQFYARKADIIDRELAAGRLGRIAITHKQADFALALAGDRYPQPRLPVQVATITDRQGRTLHVFVTLGGGGHNYPSTCQFLLAE